jgi:hypothetical protein
MAQHQEEATAKTTASLSKTIIPVRIIRRPISKRTKIIWLAALSIVIILAVLVMFYRSTQLPSAFIDGDKYQAVYLTDGSVYFGKLHLLSDGSSRLTDVYYPQKAQASDSSKASDQSTTDSKTPTQSSSLIKFGSELLGGEDQIIFNKTQVAYWVNLKSDSKVTKAIQSYKKQ